PRCGWPLLRTAASSPPRSTTSRMAGRTPPPHQPGQGRSSVPCSRGRTAYPFSVARARPPCRTRWGAHRTEGPGRSSHGPEKRSRGSWQFESVAREVFLDIAARRLGWDPVDLRRRNLLVAEDLPYTNAAGMTYDHISPAETFEQALELLDYDQFRREQAAARQSDRYLGVGTCTYDEA